jgi:ribosomal protein S18 acetylase RimI-like enzyme
MKVGIRRFQDKDAHEIQVFDSDFPLVLEECGREGEIQVAVVDESAVGYFVLVRGREPAYFDEGVVNWAELRELHVHPRFQRRGIGTRLVRAALYLAERQGFSRVYVCTDDFNLAAQGTYIKSGFRELNRIIRYRFLLKNNPRESSGDS